MGGCVTAAAHDQQNNQNIHNTTDNNYKNRQTGNYNLGPNNPKILTHPTAIFINQTPTPQIVQVPVYKSVLPAQSLMSFVNLAGQQTKGNERQNGIMPQQISTIRPVSPAFNNNVSVLQNKQIQVKKPIVNSQASIFRSDSINESVTTIEQKVQNYENNPRQQWIKNQQRPISPSPDVFSHPNAIPYPVPTKNIQQIQKPFQPSYTSNIPFSNNPNKPLFQRVQNQPYPSNTPAISNIQFFQNPLLNQLKIDKSLLDFDNKNTSSIVTPSFKTFSYGMNMPIMG